jgi:hypothetical protein
VWASVPDETLEREAEEEIYGDDFLPEPLANLLIPELTTMKANDRLLR